MKFFNLETYNCLKAIGMFPGETAVSVKDRSEKSEANYLKTLFDVSVYIKSNFGWYINIIIENKNREKQKQQERVVEAVKNGIVDAEFHNHQDVIDNISDAIAYMAMKLASSKDREQNLCFIMDGSTM